MRAISPALVLLVWLASPARGQSAATVAPPAELAAAVDSTFARWTADMPGCAIGVGRDGREVLARAYGSADLEHALPNTPETVFEAGSVSKQFTAAAIVLLAQAGKLKLDDEARRYLPEL